MLNPRVEQDNLGTMACFHRRYLLGDRCGLSVEQAREIERRCEVDGTAALVVPLYLYDHSGLRISTKPFKCPFDSGRIGIIYATYNDIRRKYGKKRISKKVLEQARLRLFAEVEEYDFYLRRDEEGAEV